VRNGGALLRDVLRAVRAQTVEAELVVADSGSTDGSAELARSFGAIVVGVDRFSHGGTRNLLMERTAGEHVAFLTQDSVPASDGWLEALLGGFGGDVALAFGPARARPEAPVAVARELEDWFASFGGARVDRGSPRGPGAQTFFSSANGAVARAAWREIPFPDVAYAEDQALAVAMLRAGYAKAYVPDAAVIHSHEYGPLAQFRRTFDEWEALNAVHGWVQPWRNTLLTLQSEVRKDVRYGGLSARELARSVRHWSVRAAGAAAGSRSGRLPPRVRAWCSLEGRS
jgi:rhamnosyltransferase